MPLYEGSRLGPYEIVAPIGAGGMGEVYRARDMRLGRTVAIKVLPAGKMADEDRKRRFIQEARAASALNHPNIVTIYDIASEGGADFLVMEYVDGRTLGRTIPKHGMRTDEVLRCAVQIADALAAAHAAGIIHRDLKPGNVMVTGDGRVKLLDFGLAKLKEPAESPADEATRTIEPQSAEGTVVGTAAYMSPEQAEAKPVDARSDIFSFGALLYEMVTGARAFHGDSQLSTLSAVLKENPKPPSQVVADVPRELERIVTRCLRKDPARRFQTAADLKVALQELKEESDSGTAEIAGASAAARPARSTRTPLYAVAALGALAIAGAGWFFLRPSAKPLPPMQSVPLTTYAGAERGPTFSPDGSQVAFMWTGEKQDKWDIYVKLVDGGAPLRLTTNPAPDVAPAWSPDGRQIAFVRVGEGAYSISPLGGPERKLADGYIDTLAWTPDGQSLLISLAKTRGGLHIIYQLSLRSGGMRQVTSPPPQRNLGDGDYHPAVSPDGRMVAFIRIVGNAAPGDIYVQPIEGGTARRLTQSPQQLGGVAWANNSEIVFAQGPYGAGTLMRMAVDGQSDPQPVSGSLGGATDPAIVHPPGKPARLAYGQRTLDGNIWRMEIAQEPNGKFRTVSPPAAVIASTRMDESPRFSPDGKRIAFASDRDGYTEIWVSASDGSNAQQLTYLRSSRSGSPKWSPDGRQIVFDSLASGNNDIWIVGSEGGPANQITHEPSNDARPSWSRDGRWIYFRSDRSGSQQIWRIPASEPYKPAVQITKGGAFEAVESLDGKLLYYIKSARFPGPGLWSVPPGGGAEKQVVQLVRAGYWAEAIKGLYFLDVAHRSPEGIPLMRFDTANGKAVQAGLIPNTVSVDNQVLAVSRDGRWVAWTQIDHQDADLMLIDNFR